MATVTIAGLTAVSASDMDDTVLFEVEDNDSASRKATLAQVRTALSAQPITITSTTTPQLTVRYDASNHVTVSVSSAGAVTLNATGASAGFTFSDGVTVSSGTTALQATTVTTLTASVRVTSATSASGTVFSATGMEAFANATYGASIGGYGTQNDVTLFNRAGAVVLGVTANTTNVLFAGALSGITTLTATSDIFGGAATEIGWTGRATLKSSADGIVELFNDALSGFTRLNFGGTTSSFPSLKRSSAELHVRVADDSAYAALDVLELKASGTKVVGAQGAAVADATDAASAITQLNAWLARARTHGLIAT